MAFALLASLCLFAAGFILGNFVRPIRLAPTKPQTDAEALPVMEAYSRTIYDAYLDAIAVTGLLRKDFSPEDTASLEEGEFLLSLAVALGGPAMQAGLQNGLLPAGFVENTLSQRLCLQPEQVRSACSGAYLPEEDAYRFVGGLGGGPAIPVITGSELKNRQMLIRYTWYTGDPAADTFYYRPENRGELVMDFSLDPPRYLSNKILPA